MAQPTFTRPQAIAAAATPVGTVLGEGLSIEGEITSSEPLTLEGSFIGRIECTDAVTVGTAATVQAEIQGATVRILGSVEGNVVAAERVEIGNDGKLVGDLRARRISIADGATFRGRIDMDV